MNGKHEPVTRATEDSNNTKAFAMALAIRSLWAVGRDRSRLVRLTAVCGSGNANRSVSYFSGNKREDSLKDTPWGTDWQKPTLTFQSLQSEISELDSGVKLEKRIVKSSRELI